MLDSSSDVLGDMIAGTIDYDYMRGRLIAAHIDDFAVAMAEVIHSVDAGDYQRALVPLTDMSFIATIDAAVDECVSSPLYFFLYVCMMTLRSFPWEGYPLNGMWKTRKERGESG